jgi:ribonuclease HI
MKQRIVVQAIIQSGDKTLLLRRSQGRPDIVGKYELPGGTLDAIEQPDDAMHRHLKNELGFTSKDIYVRDAMSMSNREDVDMQHVFIVYGVEGVSEQDAVMLGQSYDKYVWITTSQIQQNELRDSAAYLLDIGNSENSTMYYKHQHTNKDVDKSTFEQHVIIYSDGGSRGNPGPSAAAFVITMGGDTITDSGGEYLGITTNNQAEYHGVRLGLERALKLGIMSIEFRVDSMLVVNQLKGIYKIKNRELWPIYERINALLPQFERVVFKHVPRELNQQADSLVNKFLDEHHDGIDTTQYD